MNKSLASIASTALLSAALSAPVQAGFNGDTVYLDYNLAGFTSGSASATFAVVGSGVEFTGTGTDVFGQIWSFSIDVFNNGVTIGWTESTRALEPNGGNISSLPDSYNFELNFASSTVPPMALTAFSSSGMFSPGTSSLSNLSYPDSQTVHIGFGRLDSTDSYTVTAVPEPESWALLLAGLGLLGFARRRAAASCADRLSF